jgi:ATP-dependent exoDNAse (exonuclease V) alpha subunit
MSAPHLQLVEPPAADPATSLADALASEQPEVVLAGVAGAGKTTLVRRLEGALLQCAPTNKAARRLQSVTGRPTTTIHALIYGAGVEQWVRPDGEVCRGWEDDDGVRHDAPGCPGCECSSRLAFGPPKELDEAKLLVVDEASMVGKRTADDIRTAAEGRQILWVGDPAQLPPVGDVPGVDLQNPDVLLTKVWRTDGGILQLATAIRTAETWEDLIVALDASYPDVVIARGGPAAMAEWRSQLRSRMAITHTNRDRQATNALVRQRLAPARRAAGRVGSLVAGERLLIRQNVRGDGGAVVISNGEVYAALTTEPVGNTPYVAVTGQLDGELAAPVRRFAVHPEFLDALGNDDWARLAKTMAAELKPHTERCDACRGSGAMLCIECGWETEPFSKQVTPPRGWCPSCAGPRTLIPGLPNGDVKCSCGPFAGLQVVNAQYGYAITAHAAQGSEAEEVGVLWTPGSHRRSFEVGRAWLYTAVTRARSRLWVRR